MPEFEWDSEKAERNWRDHGVTFIQGARTFRDPFAIEFFDQKEDYGEDRFNRVGVCDGILLHVTYTERGERIRIISVRRAVRNEQNDYYRQNST